MPGIEAYAYLASLCFGIGYGGTRLILESVVYAGGVVSVVGRALEVH